MIRSSSGARLTRRAALGLLGAGFAGLSGLAAAVPDPLTPKVIARSQLATGDLTRLHRVFAKARRGEPITLGVIGGSITEGAMSTAPERNYAAVVLAWWRARFPGNDIRLVNAGIGGTGSLYGALRAGQDLLPSHPDLVIVEFAVNDAWTDGAPYEGLLRQILAQPNAPAVLLLFMMWEKGGNCQDFQAAIGAHYQLPMVSFRDAIWPEMAAGRVPWSEFIVDTVHPNDAGHAVVGRFVTTLLDNADRAAANRAAGPVPPLPAPLHSDAFQFVDWRKADALAPLGETGWTRGVADKGKPVWTGSHASGGIDFAWSGTGVVAVLARPEDDHGRVTFSIDGAAATVLDAATQPNRDILVVAEGLRPGPHSIEIRRDDDPAQAAQPLRLLGLGSIGVTT